LKLVSKTLQWARSSYSHLFPH